MKLVTQRPKKALKSFLKQKPLRSEMDVFKRHLIALLDKISVIEKQPKDESEEHLKNDLRDFLRDTFYRDRNAINTKDKKDLVIHLGKTTNSDVGVIIEAKRPSNIGEMISFDNANKKALHELILYYLDERNKVENFQLKQLVITNINEWYLIDANHFDQHIYNNAQIQNLYKTKVSDNKNNPFFYQEIEKIISKIDVEIPCVYFDIREYDTILRNNKKEDDKKLSALFKILSPQYLLKIATLNDSNSLNERFYKELLHIIGLEEAREGTKNVIRRKKESRNAASLIELTIDAILTEDLLQKLPDQTIYGATKDERVFNVSLELCLTWINRILFLKLLEGQLVTYHQGNKDYQFLNTEMMPSFDELFKLFHKVLAVNLQDRTEAIKGKYSKVPYLNSSLFEISELEDQAIRINSLDNVGQLELISTTILKETKKKTASLASLDYLFKFLDAYDFASEGTEDIQEDNKPLITASVLGKVFEKINGYKDGSIFTPGFITMYMCRETIRKAVVQKFNEIKKWQCKDLKTLYNKIEDLEEANKIVNSLKICDPAVGSGHFLVSALNEMIAVKNDLKILQDRDGKRLKEYQVEVVNDELIVMDEDGEFFEYNLNSKESQRIQETLFHEKQIIIENCLFGVDINPNSVKICCLRLWIELLKNAYYKNKTELETLPNIDINIKCGNSLISRFGLNGKSSESLPRVTRQKIKLATEKYKDQVIIYKATDNVAIRNRCKEEIARLKKQFVEIANPNDPDYKIMKEKQAELGKIPLLFNQKEKETWKLKMEKLAQEVDYLNQKLNTIYKNAFEWRFEFPEVLNDDGDFVGFDIVIGNPPYIKEYENRDAFNGLRNKECYQGKMDIWYLFGDLGLNLLKPNCNLCYIATNNWVTNAGASKFRNNVIKNSQIVNLTDFGAYMVFENASIQTMIMLFKNNKETDNYTFDYRRLEGEKPNLKNVLNFLNGVETSNSVLLSPTISKENLICKTLTFNTDENAELLNKIKTKHTFYLREKADKKLKINSELGQGIVAPQDVINNNSLNILKSEIANGIHHHHEIVNKDRKQILKDKYEVGTGIFVLSHKELKALNFSKKELEIIKPQYSSKQVSKYYTNPKNEDWVIYTKSDINKPNKKTKKIPLDNFPKIKQHLDNFKSVITSDFAPYGLHRAREQHFFDGGKIAVLRKCSKEPIFSYSDFECYLSAAFYVIQSSRINLKYLTGLLNSKLVAFWLRKKGKMQGNNYQLDKEPLLEIPIYKPTDSEANKIANLVDKIMTQKAQGKSSKANETKIDKLVYKLYNITNEESSIIENE